MGSHSAPVTMMPGGGGGDEADDVSSVASFEHRPPLPILAMREKIVEKIRENRVTLIVGDTGCGKSSQVPLFLLEENMDPILCTQPRRFAVVTIARTVAKSRDCEVGGEVGYHIGHTNVTNMTSERSRLVFKTAGVLLEQLRDKGAAVLKQNKVIILDEVHERSVESDLVLACVKQFIMRSSDFRVVLMSATADIRRYRDYFKDLGRGERVEVIGIPSAPQQSIFQRQVLYLEQVAELLGIAPDDSDSLSSAYCSGQNHYADASLKPQVHKLIHELILHIHENEPDTKKSILVFLPTYYSLEQQWILLKPLTSLFKVHILHRSIDTDHALLAMKIWKSHRKVILATNIAESSVTIPGVAFVIDSCRSLQVLWDPYRKTDTTELVWVSKSQAEQRKGRTGRTCDGVIYRLVTGKFYSSLDDYEHPAILRLSLRQQVLMMACAESKAINDPKVMLQKVLDPPEPETVEEALDLLVQIHALERPLNPRARYEPSFYGRLLDSLPLSFDAAVLVLKLGQLGLLREGILLSIFMDVQPLPILQPFGNPNLSTKYLVNYFEGTTGNTLEAGKRETLYMANLCAFQFWQRVFKDKHRLGRLQDIIKGKDPRDSQPMISNLEEEWCSFHNMLQTSLHNVSEIYDDVICEIHRFRPVFSAESGFPACYEPREFQHTCILQPDLAYEMNDLNLNDENLSSGTESRECLCQPYVTSYDFRANTVFETLISVIKEIRVQYSEDIDWKHGVKVHDEAPTTTHIAPLCRYFMSGSCLRGNNCFFSHSLQAQRPACKFFFTLQGCRNGASCSFSHEYGHGSPPIANPTALLQEEEAASFDSFLQLLPKTADGRVLILDDKDLKFTSSLSHHYDPAKIIVTTPHPYSSELLASLHESKIFWDVNDLYNSVIKEKDELLIRWKAVRCVLWFVETDGNDLPIKRRTLESFFEFLASKILAENLVDVNVIVTINNIRFSQLQVERLAREYFFFLTRSFRFDEYALGKLSDPIVNPRPMQVSAAISYVFRMPPADTPTGTKWSYAPPMFQVDF